MSKKLDSILQRVPNATSAPEILGTKRNVGISEKMVRVNAEVPMSVKVQIKKYLADNPGETEKTIILKGLRLLGLDIEEKYFSDLRASRYNQT